MKKQNEYIQNLLQAFLKVLSKKNVSIYLFDIIKRTYYRCACSVKASVSCLWFSATSWSLHNKQRLQHYIVYNVLVSTQQTMVTTSHCIQRFQSQWGSTSMSVWTLDCDTTDQLHERHFETNEICKRMHLICNTIYI